MNTERIRNSTDSSLVRGVYQAFTWFWIFIQIPFVYKILPHNFQEVMPMKKSMILAVAAIVLVALFAGTAFAAPAKWKNYASVSIAPDTVMIKGIEYVTGAVSSPGGIKGLTVYVGGRAHRPILTVGKWGEKHMNGKWIVRMPHSKGRHGVANVKAVVTPKNFGRRGVKNGTDFKQVACVDW